MVARALIWMVSVMLADPFFARVEGQKAEEEEEEEEKV